MHSTKFSPVYFISCDLTGTLIVAYIMCILIYVSYTLNSRLNNVVVYHSVAHCSACGLAWKSVVYRECEWVNISAIIDVIYVRAGFVTSDGGRCVQERRRRRETLFRVTVVIVIVAGNAAIARHQHRISECG